MNPNAITPDTATAAAYAPSHDVLQILLALCRPRKGSAVRRPTASAPTAAILDPKLGGKAVKEVSHI